MSDTIKVFEMDDVSWWAGTDAESVKAAFLAAPGNEEAEEYDLIEPAELNDEDMARMKYGESRDEEISFREQLDKLIAGGQKFPCFFATTEY